MEVIRMEGRMIEISGLGKEEKSSRILPKIESTGEGYSQRG